MDLSDGGKGTIRNKHLKNTMKKNEKTLKKDQTKQAQKESFANCDTKRTLNLQNSLQVITDT